MDSRWYFTEEQLANSPSREKGVNAEQELSYRQRAANLIQEIGQRLQVSQLCINTAIVYMHRFYAFHSFTLFHRNSIAAAAFFLAAKVEEQPRKLEHVIKILNICLEKNDNTRESYAEQAQELVFNENVLLQTLGFDVAIDHPHTHVVRACQLFNIVTVSRELRQTCYFMASNSLHLTTMCLKYRPTVVAAFCIYIACKWSRWEIPDSSEGKAWYSYVDENVTTDTLKELTDEYLQILERSPSKFKSKMKAITSNGHTGINQSPSVHSRDDAPSLPHPKSQHDKHHHHHHSRGTSGSSSVNRKQPSELGLGSTSSKQQVSSQASSSSYKNQTVTQTGPSSSTSSTHLQRQRPSASGAQQQPYPVSSDTTQKSVNEERTQHRQMLQENPSFNMMPRPIEKARTSSSQSAASVSSQQHPLPHPKPVSHEQRHLSSKSLTEMHQKGLKSLSGASSTAAEVRSSSSSSHPQQAPQLHKKPSWTQHQSSLASNLQKSAQSHAQASQIQPNLHSTSATSNRTSSLPSYNESTKQNAQPSAQNDYWFSDKSHEVVTKPVSPLRPTIKSMFSPSPEHDPYDRSEMLIASIKQTNSPKITEKQDRRSSTPNKREKRPDAITPSSQKSSHLERKSATTLDHLTTPFIPDLSTQMKKRPFASVEDAGEFSQNSKARKIDPTKTETTHLTGSMMKQPIETNPDIVKSLLQECYTTSKFDSFGMGSPLDVITPESSHPLSQLTTTKMDTSESLPNKTADNGFDDDHHKRNKSKKKKEKHRHKNKKKSHKSDREDRDEQRKDNPLKINFSDSKSSPDSGHAPGGLRIKIPMKGNLSDITGGSSQQAPVSLKLRISKDKIGQAFNPDQMNIDVDASSSSYRKKEKDRVKSKSSKHGNNHSNSDAGYQQQQQQQMSTMNKMRPQFELQSQDVASKLGSNNQPPRLPNNRPTVNPIQQQQGYHSFDDFFQNSTNYLSDNGVHK